MLKVPLISVVIPTCHRNDLLANCLEPLCSNSSGVTLAEYEVIVTDDGTKTTAEHFLNKQFPFVQWTNGPKRGPAANRNHGAKVARGEWVAFLDDDCIPTPGWLPALIRSVQTHNVQVIEGRTSIPDKADRPLTHAVENHSGGLYWSCNLAVKREFFLQVGGFDEDFTEAGGEDMEFAHRFRALGGTAIFCEQALVWHPQYPISMGKLLRKIPLERWSILYAFKTGIGLDLSWPVIQCVWRELVNTVANALRTSWKFVRTVERRYWKTQLFLELWKWIIFVPVLVIKLIWTVRFRDKLLDRSNKKRQGTTAPCCDR